MGLSWKATEDGGYEATAPEGVYRVVTRAEEWCLEKPLPRPGRIGGFSSPVEAMAWGGDIHLAATGNQVRTARSAWPTVDELAREVETSSSSLRSWLAAHVGGSTSPRRRIDPHTQHRIWTFYGGENT
ncbi:hypothetical protein [Cellulosimicrobium sp. Marseille-Q4280]|uniref:hypothetical protein n=1 Tax=Cellulosimicrobium sp. Marseille-Q4280 TaxID=2937992 RepID=UPI00203F33DD|nr:hypothetical protein [Cellulosimicrobium sp. Marseille-Q4280]